jgi:hypothetical protein
MTVKKVGVKKAGDTTIRDVELTEATTAADVLGLLGCPTNGDFLVTTGIGQPAFSMKEPVFDRVQDGGKLYVIPTADAGA